MQNVHNDKKELFESVPVPKALATMAVPTIISQLINLVYNMVDAFFIGRTGNSYMMAATTLTLTLVMMTVALSNLFGIGGGSLTARLMGSGRPDEAGRVSSFSLFGAFAVAALYASFLGAFSYPILRFLGASDNTVGFARQYMMIVLVAGGFPSILSLVLAHLLRNAGYSGKASIGLSSGGILNMALDPLFMFVLLPKGMEVTGAALATLVSNTVSFAYLAYAYYTASKTSPISMDPKEALRISGDSVRKVFAVGVPSFILTGLFDAANICVNMIASRHGDLVLAAMGIVMKIDRIPNAVNVGICQGMLPIIAYNYSSGDHKRMRSVINCARLTGLCVAGVSIVLLFSFAGPLTRLFLSTSTGHAEEAMTTVAFAAVFLRIRCFASPVQYINYHTSYCMQAMGQGAATMLHAFVRELVFYIPLMFTLDRFFGENGLAAALPVGESFGAAFALLLLRYILRKQKSADDHR